MTVDRSQPDFEEEVLARFLRELEAATDRAAVVRSYADRHPALAEELARLEEMNRLVAHAGRDETANQPTQLGEFRILRWITRGGMGDIYEAVQDRLNRRVIVKTIRRGRFGPHIRGRFFREQRVLARLHQTHIVPIHTAGEEGDLLYLVMPFIDGAPLSDLVRAAAAAETDGSGSKTPSLAELAQRFPVARPASEKPAGVPPTDQSTLKQDPFESNAPGPAMTGRRRVLSVDYFRSVARVLADAAEAIEHAHRLNIIHRDLKPSNILIDHQGHCWIIDFGLAGYLGYAGSKGSAEPIGDEGEGLTTGGIIGTPQYMSPEQWRGKPADARSDVWGLGATLYELLTLRRAFDGPTDCEAQDRVLGEEPTPPRKLIRNVPADLAAVCHKALRKEAAERYPSAKAFGDDLRRWLRHEPVRARPARTMRRLALWGRRNPGRAAGIAAAVFAAAGLVNAAVQAERYERVQAEAHAQAAIEVERQQAAAARRQQWMLELQKMRLGTRGAGWRKRGLTNVRFIQGIQGGEDLRGEVAAVLAGLDAARARDIPSGASDVTFDRAARQLLLGGLSDSFGRPQSGARIVYPATGQVLAVSRLRGGGPIAFRDEAALQLVPKAEDRWTLVIWDVARQQPLRTISLADAKPEPVTAETYPTLALAADGSLAAASALSPGERFAGGGTLRVWDIRTGKCLFEWPRTAKAECLAFSPDGALLAIGEANGEIEIRALADGKPLPALSSAHRTIQSLAFGRDPHKRDDHAGRSWLLAAADASSRVTVWDLHERSPRCQCHGTWFAINGLSFSPDGMILASAGRGGAKLWDITSGRLLLEVGDTITHAAAAAFDPDGRRLTVAGNPIAPVDDRVEVWNLENGRDAATFTGLVGPIAKTAFSADGRYLAALSQQWQVGVWDREAGRLLHVLDGPRGEFVDNAALAFDPPGSQIACAGGGEVILWNVKTGERAGHWPLPPGLQDALAFDPTGRGLWSVRCETVGGKPPFTHVDPREHPRLYPVRNLLGPRPTAPVSVIRTPDLQAEFIFLTPDAGTCVMNLYRKADGRRCDTVRAFALPAGTESWSRRAARGDLRMDPTGKLLGFVNDTGRPVMVALHSPDQVTPWETGEIGAGGKWSLNGDRLGVGDTEIAHLDIDKQRAEGAQFSPCGKYLALGRKDGAVVVYELEEFRKHLAEFGNP